MTQIVPLGHDFSRIWSASLTTNLVDGVLRLAALALLPITYQVIA